MRSHCGRQTTIGTIWVATLSLNGRHLRHSAIGPAARRSRGIQLVCDRTPAWTPLCSAPPSHFCSSATSLPRSTPCAAEAAEAVQRQASGELLLPQWNPTADGNHLLRSEDRKWLWMFAPLQTNIQVLGANRVYDNRTQLLALLGTTLDKMKPDRVTRAGFQLQCFIDLQMTFPEMVHNFFGTLLPEKRH